MKRRGFTLIELLVVIAIIGALIAILIPTLGVVRKKANTARCATSVRGLSQGVQMYLADWQKMIPFNSTPHGSWVQVLGNRPNGGIGGINDLGYGASLKLSTCPEAIAPDGVNTVGTAHFQWYGVDLVGATLSGSYGINGWTYALPQDAASQGVLYSAIPASDNGKYFDIIKAGRTAEIPLFFDANWRHTWPRPTDPAPTGPTYNLDNNGPTSTNTTEPPNNCIHPMQRAVMDRHRRAVNVSYVDGHVETVKLEDLWSKYWHKGYTPPNAAPTLPSH